MDCPAAGGAPGETCPTFQEASSDGLDEGFLHEVEARLFMARLFPHVAVKRKLVMMERASQAAGSPAQAAATRNCSSFATKGSLHKGEYRRREKLHRKLCKVRQGWRGAGTRNPARLKRGNRACCATFVRPLPVQRAISQRMPNGTGVAGRLACSHLHFAAYPPPRTHAGPFLCGQTHTLQVGAIACIYGRAPSGWPAIRRD